jgi:RNA 3'-terminal phosphate cyclase
MMSKNQSLTITLSITALQNLPKELQNEVCKRLSIPEGSGILKEKVSDATERELAAIISEYTKLTEVSEKKAPGFH